MYSKPFTVKIAHLLQADSDILEYHRELELLVKAGLTPSEALAAATANVADALRLSDRGRIIAGRRADLLLVRGSHGRYHRHSRDQPRLEIRC
jgi:imidazolonepropionase-like amidohydrolase